MTAMDGVKYAELDQKVYLQQCTVQTDASWGLNRITSRDFSGYLVRYIGAVDFEYPHNDTGN